MTTAIVLAAGFSRRLGRPKQLVEIEGETLVHRVARLACEVFDDVAIVVRPDDAATAAAVAGLAVRIVSNAEAGEGMAASIRAGVSASAGDVVILLCDQPGITAAHLRNLIEVPALIAATGYGGIAGVPARFAERYRGELLALRGDVGARSIIERHRDEVAVIPLEEAAVDVDGS